MPKIVSEEVKQRTKDIMYQETVALIKEKGLRKITIDDITSHSGLSKGSFYLYYRSREEMLYEVIKRCESAMFTSIMALKDSGLPKRDLIKKGLYDIYLAEDSLVLYITDGELKSLYSKLPPSVYELEKEKSNNYFEQAMALFEVEPGHLDMSVLGQLMDALAFMANNSNNHYKEGRAKALQLLVNAIADYILS